MHVKNLFLFFQSDFLKVLFNISVSFLFLSFNPFARLAR